MAPFQEGTPLWQSIARAEYYWFALSFFALMASSLERMRTARFYLLSLVFLGGLAEFVLHSLPISVQIHLFPVSPLETIVIYLRLIDASFFVAIYLLCFFFASTPKHKYYKDTKQDNLQQYKIFTYRGTAGKTTQEYLAEQAKQNTIAQELTVLAAEENVQIASLAFAQYMDANDKLKEYRDKFHFPRSVPSDEQSDPLLYFCGNSLGLQPKNTQTYLNDELQTWQRYGVKAHFSGKFKWFQIEEVLVEKMAKVVGAKPVEVAVMNTLTVNLHLGMVAFYRPTQQRYKILIEENPFPSDMHAIVSQIKYHGFDPEKALIQVGPRKGENFIRTEDILQIIEREGTSLALVLFGDVQFLTGQAFELEKITKTAHKMGAYMGVNFAHGAGNLELKLHDWDIDFAAWCTYKYLNSGPGNIAGFFLHERYAQEHDLPRFCGWWGHKRKTRFQLTNRFEPQDGAASFQLSNPPVICMITLLASLELFEKATMQELRKKSLLLTGYLEHLLDTQIAKDKLSILTPRDPNQRGCQISIRVSNVDTIMKMLDEQGVVVDEREPDVIRISPAPLYNSFEDVYRAVMILKKVLEGIK